MSDAINQHKRMAMGGGGNSNSNYKVGGTVRGPNVTPVGAPAKTATGGGSPLTSARRNNGVPGMNKGGKVCK